MYRVGQQNSKHRVAYRFLFHLLVGCLRGRIRDVSIVNPPITTNRQQNHFCCVFKTSLHAHWPWDGGVYFFAFISWATWVALLKWEGDPEWTHIKNRAFFFLLLLHQDVSFIETIVLNTNIPWSQPDSLLYGNPLSSAIVHIYTLFVIIILYVCIFWHFYFFPASIICIISPKRDQWSFCSCLCLKIEH